MNTRFDKKINVTVAVHNVDRAVAFEHLVRHHAQTVNYTFILIQNKKGRFADFLAEKKIRYVEINYRSKKNLFTAFVQIVWELIKHRPDVIHAHLFIPGLLLMTAGFLLGIKKRIYTRHHSDFHHVYHPSTVKYDRYINRLATRIISVSPVVSTVLREKEGVPPEKITEILHGFDFSDFAPQPVSVLDALKEKYDLTGFHPLILVVSRYIKLKGFQYILPAFEHLLTSFPGAKLVIANAQGVFRPTLEEDFARLPPESFIEIPFESNIAGLYQLADVFIHTPIGPTVEAFGQVYVEALASGVPSVVTLSGIASAVIREGENATVVPYKESMAIFSAVKDILTRPELAERYRKAGPLSVQGFDFETHARKVLEVYGKD